MQSLSLFLQDHFDCFFCSSSEFLLHEKSNFESLPGRAGGSPIGLLQIPALQAGCRSDNRPSSMGWAVESGTVGARKRPNPRHRRPAGERLSPTFAESVPKPVPFRQAQGSEFVKGLVGWDAHSRCETAKSHFFPSSMSPQFFGGARWIRCGIS